MEKADILEMTVKYLRQLQRTNGNTDKTPGTSRSYCLGFNECTQEVSQFFRSQSPISTKVKGSLLEHLDRCAPHNPPDSPSSSPTKPTSDPAANSTIIMPTITDSNSAPTSTQNNSCSNGGGSIIASKRTAAISGSSVTSANSKLSSSQIGDSILSRCLLSSIPVTSSVMVQQQNDKSKSGSPTLIHKSSSSPSLIPTSSSSSSSSNEVKIITATNSRKNVSTPVAVSSTSDIQDSGFKDDGDNHYNMTGEESDSFNNNNNNNNSNNNNNFTGNSSSDDFQEIVNDNDIIIEIPDTDDDEKNSNTWSNNNSNNIYSTNPDGNDRVSLLLTGQPQKSESSSAVPKDWCKRRRNSFVQKVRPSRSSIESVKCDLLGVFDKTKQEDNGHSSKEDVAIVTAKTEMDVAKCMNQNDNFESLVRPETMNMHECQADTKTHTSMVSIHTDAKSNNETIPNNRIDNVGTTLTRTNLPLSEAPSFIKESTSNIVDKPLVKILPSSQQGKCIVSTQAQIEQSPAVLIPIYIQTSLGPGEIPSIQQAFVIKQPINVSNTSPNSVSNTPATCVSNSPSSTILSNTAPLVSISNTPATSLSNIQLSGFSNAQMNNVSNKSSTAIAFSTGSAFQSSIQPQTICSTTFTNGPLSSNTSNTNDQFGGKIFETSNIMPSVGYKQASITLINEVNKNIIPGVKSIAQNSRRMATIIPPNNMQSYQMPDTNGQIIPQKPDNHSNTLYHESSRLPENNHGDSIPLPMITSDYELKEVNEELMQSGNLNCDSFSNPAHTTHGNNENEEATKPIYHYYDDDEYDYYDYDEGEKSSDNQNSSLPQRIFVAGSCYTSDEDDCHEVEHLTAGGTEPFNGLLWEDVDDPMTGPTNAKRSRKNTMSQTSKAFRRRHMSISRKSPRDFRTRKVSMSYRPIAPKPQPNIDNSTKPGFGLMKHSLLLNNDGHQGIVKKSSFPNLLVPFNDANMQPLDIPRRRCVTFSQRNMPKRPFIALETDTANSTTELLPTPGKLFPTMDSSITKDNSISLQITTPENTTASVESNPREVLVARRRCFTFSTRDTNHMIKPGRRGSGGIDLRCHTRRMKTSDKPPTCVEPRRIHNASISNSSSIENIPSSSSSSMSTSSGSMPISCHRKRSSTFSTTPMNKPNQTARSWVDVQGHSHSSMSQHTRPSHFKSQLFYSREDCRSLSPILSSDSPVNTPADTSNNIKDFCVTNATSHSQVLRSDAHSNVPSSQDDLSKVFAQTEMMSSKCSSEIERTEYNERVSNRNINTSLISFSSSGANASQEPILIEAEMKSESKTLYTASNLSMAASKGMTNSNHDIPIPLITVTSMETSDEEEQPSIIDNPSSTFQPFNSPHAFSCESRSSPLNLTTKHREPTEPYSKNDKCVINTPLPMTTVVARSPDVLKVCTRLPTSVVGRSDAMMACTNTVPCDSNHVTWSHDDMRQRSWSMSSGISSLSLEGPRTADTSYSTDEDVWRPW